MDRHTPTHVHDLHPLAALAWEAAHQAGSFLRDERPANLIVSSKSTPTDVVTEMDRGAEALIVSRIREVRPDDAIVGEEGTNTPGTTGVRWIIDPLDGTVNYLYGLPMWGVSIGVEVAGIGELGVIMTPALHEGFVAARGRGAWHVDGAGFTRMRPRACSSLDQALITTGFGYSPERRRSQAELLLALITRVRDIRRTGCATIDLCWLALGRTDAYFERGLNVWDYAAGIVIAREADLMVEVRTGPQGSGELLVCAGSEIFHDLTSVLLELGADSGP